MDTLNLGINTIDAERANESAQPELPLAEKLAILAKAKGYSQSELAGQIDISRVSINRFFKGRSSIRTKDLVQLLKVLDIDLEEVVNQKLENAVRPGAAKSASRGLDPVYEDLISVIEHLDSKAKKNVFEQVIWWGRCVLNEPARKASDRLYTQLNPSLNAASVAG
ncbi:MAG: helix-turn-helix transcriptional regulator [Bdellovibrionales bacterium]|nr:helix-turn-helix transcriptional regulator [Bdellovibrionales bacterium]